MSEPDRAARERRLQELLERLAVEEDPKEAARLMREHEQLSDALRSMAGAAARRIVHPPSGDRPSTPES